MKVLITGIAGSFDSNIAKHIINGHQTSKIIGLDNFPRKESELKTAQKLWKWNVKTKMEQILEKIANHAEKKVYWLSQTI